MDHFKLQLLEEHTEETFHLECCCESCGFLENWHHQLYVLLMWGILFPPIWLAGAGIVIYGLFHLNSQPLRRDEYIPTTSGSIATRVKDSFCIDDFEYLNTHFITREKAGAIAGYCALGTCLYTVFAATMIVTYKYAV